jgi:hypothetical protein
VDNPVSDTEAGSAGVREKDESAGNVLHPLVTKPATANGIKSRIDAMEESFLF